MCQRAGVRVCNPFTATGPTVCDATPGTGGSEVCNDVDDDCDGVVDNGTDLQLCGGSGTCVGGICQPY